MRGVERFTRGKGTACSFSLCIAAHQKYDVDISALSHRRWIAWTPLLARPVLFLLTLHLCTFAVHTEQLPSTNLSTLGRNASEEAYHRFHLTLSEEEEGSYKSHRHIQAEVFKDGRLQPGWIPTPRLEEYNHSQTIWSQFLHDQYADRIAFEFSFAGFLNYDLRVPVVTASNHNTAKPKVLDFQVSNEDSSGSFAIIYDCQHLSGAQLHRNITVSVVFPIVSDLSLYFSFLKTCGGGKHKYIEFGYFEESNHIAFEASRVTFQSNQSALTVGPHVMSTRVYVHLYYPAKSQEFFHVTTNTTNGSLSVLVRGPVFGGVVRSYEDTVIHVLYDCRATGVFQVSIQVPIWPFEPLSASWRKDCGGGLAEGLNVGTSPQIKSDVVVNAKTREKWRLALHTTSRSISDQVPVVNTSTRFTDFWLSNDGMTVHVAPPVTTVENQAILAAYSSSSGEANQMFKSESGGLLSKDGKLRLHVRMVCKRNGMSLVIVTFPIKSFTNVEFGFVKLCTAPRRYTKGKFLRTADSVTGVASILLTASLAYWWHRQLQHVDVNRADKAARGYRRV